MSSALRVRDFSVYRRGIPLIKEVSFDLEKGEILRITGENGTGKTTVLESFMGFHREWRGVLELGSRDLSYKRQRGVAFESLTLDEAWCLIVGAALESHYRRLLEDLNLVDISANPIGLLSGGEAQRAMLILALLRRHDILLLDEPLVGIDGESVALMTDCILKHASASAIVLVEHNPSETLNATKEVRLERFVD